MTSNTDTPRAMAVTLDDVHEALRDRVAAEPPDSAQWYIWRAVEKTAAYASITVLARWLWMLDDPRHWSQLVAMVERLLQRNTHSEAVQREVRLYFVNRPEARHD